jgi:hypothetical protein
MSRGDLALALARVLTDTSSTMPRVLLYTGIVLSLVIALMLAGAVLDQVMSRELLPYGAAVSEGLETRTAARNLVLLLMAIPVGALYLRIASLIAVRNLFASVLAVSAISCSLLSGLFLFALHLEPGGVGLHGEPGFAANLAIVAGHLVAIFLSLTFLTLLPYFWLHSRLVALSTFLPALAYLVLLVEKFLHGSLYGEALASAAFILSIAITAAAVAVHSLRHRHAFLEVTNLRDVLAGTLIRRLDPSVSPSD